MIVDVEVGRCNEEGSFEGRPQLYTWSMAEVTPRDFSIHHGDVNSRNRLDPSKRSITGLEFSAQASTSWIHKSEQ